MSSIVEKLKDMLGNENVSKLPDCYGGYIKKNSACQINCVYKKECIKVHAKKEQKQKNKIMKNHQGLIDKVEHILGMLEEESFFIHTNSDYDLYKFHKYMKGYSGHHIFYAGLRNVDKNHCRNTGKLSIIYGSKVEGDEYREKSKRMVKELLEQENLIIVDKSSRQFIQVKERKRNDNIDKYRYL